MVPGVPTYLLNQRKGRSFQAFVVRHIDETIPADTLKKAAKNAKTRCPANATGLSKLIARAAAD
jgi:hypothetical protein